MRERIEDLGRLAVLLHELQQHPVFDRCRHAADSQSDFVEYYLPPECNPETKEIWIERLWDLYGHLECLWNELYECCEIAEGKDSLNKE